MNIFILVVLGLIYICTAHAYVYVQVQKGDKDTSNVDALIHKEVPSESVGAITDQLKETFQKKKMTNAKYKRFEVRKRTDEDASQEKQVLHDSQDSKKQVLQDSQDSKKQDLQDSQDSKKQLDNNVLPVDTNAKPESPSMRSPKITGIDIVDQLLDAVKDFGKNSQSPLMRARDHYNIKPELIQFRHSAKPSLKFEVNSESIVKLAKELLASPSVRRYADEIAQKAAVIFKVIKQELKKDS